MAEVKNRGMVQVIVPLAAGVSKRFGISGDYFHVLTAPVNDLKVRFDDSRQESIYEGVGKRVYYDSFDLESATGQTVVIEAGYGSVFDGRASANVNVTTNIAPGNTLDNGGDVSIAASSALLLSAANPTRLYLLVTNPSSNSNSFRIGSATVGASNGILLEPGTTLPVATTAAVYAYNTNDGSGGTESLSVASVKEV